MGIDAYNLAPRLGQLKNLPDSHIDGHTGQLSMDSAQRIERSLPWAEIQNGQVKRLP
jgi:outer membrane PBP1 activator LpoA protein